MTRTASVRCAFLVAAPGRGMYAGGMGWIFELSEHDAYGLACRLRLTTCPLCRHETKDRRERLGSLRFSGCLWTCHACNQGGNSYGLLCAVVLGRTKPNGSAEWRRVKTAAHALGVGGSVEVAQAYQPPPPYLREARTSVANTLTLEAFNNCEYLDLWDNWHRRAMGVLELGFMAEEVERRRLEIVKQRTLCEGLKRLKALAAEQTREERRQHVLQGDVGWKPRAKPGGQEV